jgi:hypothetical protein
LLSTQKKLHDNLDSGENLIYSATQEIIQDAKSKNDNLNSSDNKKAFNE